MRGKYERNTQIREKITGKKNPNFKKGLYCKNSKKDIEKEKPNLREIVFERDRYVCQMCVRKFNPKDLMIYYCTGKGMPTKNINNILTICLNCERLLDGGKTDRWNKEDILNFRLCMRQTETVYPIGRSPNKKWYSIIYAGGRRREINPNYKEKTTNEMIETAANFNKEELEEAMIKVLKERGQDPKDWGFEKQLVAESVGI